MIAPHVLELGSSTERAELRVGTRWVKVYDGPVAGVLILDRARAVVLQRPRLLFREDAGVGIPLDPDACPNDTIAATHEGDRIVCVDVRSGTDPLASVVQLDAHGKILRSDRAAASSEHPWSAATAALDSWELLGFTTEWEPVLALRSAASPTRFDVHVLATSRSRVIDELAIELQPGALVHFANRDRVTARLGPLVRVYWSSY